MTQSNLCSSQENDREATTKLDLLQPILHVVPMLLQFPNLHFGVDYDKEADVLYISFCRPQKTTTTIMTEDGLLLRYQEKQLVGITVLDASTRV